MKIKKRPFDILSLAFLDVITCGFGAVILLVLISKPLESPIVDDADEASYLLAQVLEAEILNESLLTQKISAEESSRSKQLLLSRLELIQADVETKNASLRKSVEQIQEDVSGLEAVQSSLDRLKQSNLSQKTSKSRDEEVGGIPVDSDYVIFIVDTSGSMQEIWKRVINEIENIINIHPKIKGFQILNDNGAHILSAYQGRWIPDTPQRRKGVIELLQTWTSASNSSPVEGLEVALKKYVNPNVKVSIYIFGDEYSGSSFDPVINALVQLNTNRITGERMARVHGVGFISNYSTGRYATLMREVARQNGGTFIALPR